VQWFYGHRTVEEKPLNVIRGHGGRSTQRQTQVSFGVKIVCPCKCALCLCITHLFMQARYWNQAGAAKQSTNAQSKRNIISVQLHASTIRLVTNAAADTCIIIIDVELMLWALRYAVDCWLDNVCVVFRRHWWRPRREEAVLNETATPTNSPYSPRTALFLAQAI